MALARSTDNLLIDFSDDIELTPRIVTTFSDMGLYSTHNIKVDFAQVEIVREVGGVLQDSLRGGDRSYVGSENAKTFRFDIPHFSLDRGMTRADIANLREYGTGANLKTVASEVGRVMKRIRGIHARTREAAIIDSIRGQAYAPNNTVNYNYYDEFGVGALKKTFALKLGDPSVDPRTTIELEARQHIIDNIDDGSHSTKPVVVFSSKGFQAFIDHPLVKSAYNFFSTNTGGNPNRDRLGMGSPSTNARSWDTIDVTYVEDISRNVSDTECLVFPLGVEEHFRMYYAPMDDMLEVGESGREIFLFYKEDRFHREYKVESETNMLVVNTRPELTCHGTVTYS